jgi:hypothetical protein
LKRRSMRRWMVGLAVVLSGILMLGGFVAPNHRTALAAVDYAVEYTQNDWGSGATVSVKLTNNGSSPINGWTLAWTFSGNQKITNIWNESYTQNGASVTATNATYNSTIPANGGTVSFGFNISYSGTNSIPTSFTLNGNSPATPTPGVTATPTSPPPALPQHLPLRAAMATIGKITWEQLIWGQPSPIPGQA